MDDIEVKLAELESKDQKPVYCIKCSKELKTIEYFGGISAYCGNKNCSRYGLSTDLVYIQKDNLK